MTRAIVRWTAQGVLDKIGRYYVITDMAKLQRIASGTLKLEA